MARKVAKFVDGKRVVHTIDLKKYTLNAVFRFQEEIIK